MKSHVRPNASGGFTLLEMVLGLTILAMLSGTVYSIISGAVQTAARMRISQDENDQVSHFIRLCRQTFQSLPSTAGVIIKTADTTSGQPELTISGSPEIFSFGPNPSSYNDTILGLQPDAAATELAEDNQPVFSLGISRTDIVPPDPDQNSALVRSGGEGLLAPDAEGRVWMPLLANVASLTWRAYKNDEEEWLEEWDGTDLPLLVEMNLLLSGRSEPIRAVYTLPVLKLAGANKALAPKQSATTSLASSNNNSGGGNDGRRGGNDRGDGRDGRDGRGPGGDRGGPPGPGGPRGGPPPGGGRPGGGGPPAGGPGGPGGAPSAGGGTFAPSGGGGKGR